MNNKELLFNLIKKLEIDELIFHFEDEDNKLYLESKDGERIYLFTLNIEDNDISVFWEDAKLWKKVNDKFKEKFYQEKGLDKCWYKDCSNKIFQSGINRQIATNNPKNPEIDDYRAINIQCKDKHKRYICLNCYTTKNHD